jgi:hypothetical protein
VLIASSQFTTKRLTQIFVPGFWLASMNDTGGASAPRKAVMSFFIQQVEGLRRVKDITGGKFFA